MPHNALSTLHYHQVSRRGFLKFTGVTAATTALGAASLSHLAYAAALMKEQREKLTPDEIIALMKKGNQRFRSGKE